MFLYFFNIIKNIKIFLILLKISFKIYTFIKKLNKSVKHKLIRISPCSNSSYGRSRLIPARKSRMGRVNVDAASHDKLNRQC